MFVLDELDKILYDWFALGKKDSRKISLRLPDVANVNVDDMQLDNRASFLFRLEQDNFTVRKGPSLAQIFDLTTSQPSTNAVLVNLVNQVVLSKVAQVPEQHYQSAKLIICDEESYFLLMKLNRITSHLNLDGSSTKCLINLIHKPPYNVTAIFLLSDIVDLFDRERQPLAFVKQDLDTGKQLASYNYALIRQTFPYLKMSDLIILLQDKRQPDTDAFKIGSNREDQILQFLRHFAHSTRLIETSSINKEIGHLHLIYDNVVISQLTKHNHNHCLGLIYNKLPMSYLLAMVEQLVRLSDKLKLNLGSVSYRAADSTGQAKMFAQILTTSYASAQRQEEPSSQKNSATVLVLDRFYDIHTCLLHADRYGPFLEQERQSSVWADGMIKHRMDTADELDERLQLAPLTEVLSIILKYAANLRPKEGSGASGIRKPLSSANLSSRSIRRHLETIKNIYKQLNEGYLLLLRLELSLETILNQLRSLSQPLAPNKQAEIVETLQRVQTAFGQLIFFSSKSVRATDMIRVACVATEAVNLFLHVHKQTSTDITKTNKLMQDIRRSFLFGKGSEKHFKLLVDDGFKNDDIIKKLDAFDRLSRENIVYRSNLSLEEIIEKFYLKQLDQTSYPTSELNQTGTKISRIVVLVFLGVMTHNELSRIKVLESVLKRNSGLKDICVVTNALLKPQDFIQSLKLY